MRLELPDRQYKQTLSEAPCRLYLGEYVYQNHNCHLQQLPVRLQQYHCCQADMH